MGLNVYGLQNVSSLTGNTKDPKKTPVEYASDAGMWGTVGLNFAITIVLIIILFKSFKGPVYKMMAVLLLLGAVAADLTFMIMVSADTPNVKSPYVQVYGVNAISYFIRIFFTQDLLFNDFAPLFGGRRR